VVCKDVFDRSMLARISPDPGPCERPRVIIPVVDKGSDGRGTFSSLTKVPRGMAWRVLTENATFPVAASRAATKVAVPWLT
jgi:hypothetical protein